MADIFICQTQVQLLILMIVSVFALWQGYLTVLFNSLYSMLFLLCQNRVDFIIHIKTNQINSIMINIGQLSQ